MAFHNLAREYSTTTGTSDCVLTGAVPGCNTWEDAGVTNGETVRYGIITYNTSTHRPTHSEIGTGTYTTATNTLARTTVISSTNSGSKITLTGLSEVFITPAASDVTLIVKEQDAAPSVTGVTTIKVTNGSLTDDGSGVVSIATGAGGGAGTLKFASYSDSTGDNFTNGSTNNTVGVDTEDVDQNTLASVASDTVTIAASGWFHVRAFVDMSSGTAFNGKALLTLNGPWNMQKAAGYTTAMGITYDAIQIDAIFNCGASETINMQFDNSLGSTVTVTCLELSFERLGDV